MFLGQSPPSFLATRQFLLTIRSNGSGPSPPTDGGLDGLTGHAAGFDGRSEAEWVRRNAALRADPTRSCPWPASLRTRGRIEYWKPRWSRCCSCAAGRSANPPWPAPWPCGRRSFGLDVDSAPEPSLRQSGESFRKVLGYFRALGKPLRSKPSRPCGSSSPTAPHRLITGRRGDHRGFSGVNLLVIDEAARVMTACTEPSGPCWLSAAAGWSRSRLLRPTRLVLRSLAIERRMGTGLRDGR